MGLFGKATYEEWKLAFRYEELEEDAECGGITIVAYGNVAGRTKYCCATYTMKKAVMYDNGDYEEIISLLKDNENKRVNVRIKMKDDEAKDFKIDLSSLATLYHDDRFLNLDLVCWGFYDRWNSDRSYS